MSWRVDIFVGKFFKKNVGIGSKYCTRKDGLKLGLGLVFLVSI